MKQKQKQKQKQKGFSIVELLLAIVIFAIFTAGILNLSLDTIQRDSKINLSTEALLYAREGIEAVRNIRDKNYLLLVNGDKGLSYASGNWSFVQAPEDIDGFYSRTITIEDVYRDENGDIDEEGLDLDPDTKKITSQVSWLQKGVIPKSIILTTYMTNWRGDEWIETTCAEFNAGTYEDTVSEGAEAPPADNCDIVLDTDEVETEIINSINVSRHGHWNPNHGHHGTDVVVDGNYAYVATDHFYTGINVVDISDVENLSVVKEVNVGWGASYVRKVNDYLYVGVKNIFGGLAVVDVSNPVDAFLYFTRFIGGRGNQPAVSDDYLFMPTDTSFYSFRVYDVSEEELPYGDWIESYDFGHDRGEVIEIKDDIAYVGTTDDNNGLVIMDISNPYDVSKLSDIDVGEEVDAIALSGPIAYVGVERQNDSLKVVNISDSRNPALVASLDVGGEIKDLVIAGDYLYAAVDNPNAGLAVINISNPFSPTLVTNLDVMGKASGIDADDNYVYLAVKNKQHGLVIVGRTTTIIEQSGSFTSQIFDTGSNDTRYNYIEWDHTEVPNGSLKFRIRTANTAENIALATWVGADGTNATFYENARTSIVLDPSRSGQRYIQYKAYMESDGASSPTLHSVTINYSP